MLQMILWQMLLNVATLKFFIYMYIYVNIISYVLILYEKENLLKYNVNEWLIYISILCIMF